MFIYEAKTRGFISTDSLKIDGFNIFLGRVDDIKTLKPSLDQQLTIED